MKKVSKKAKMRLIIFGIPSFLMIVYFIFTLTSSIFNYISLKREENSLKSELASLLKEKEDLKIEIDKLNDPEYVARYAKEKYLYSQNGEYVIKIEENLEKIKTKQKSNNTILYITGSFFLVLVILIIKKRTKVL